MFKEPASDCKWSPGIVPLRQLSGLGKELSEKEVNFRSVELPVHWLLAVNSQPSEIRSKVLECLARHDYVNLPNLMSFREGQSPDLVYQDYQLSSLLKKSVNMKVDCDPELVARETSKWAEEQCSASNLRFEQDMFSPRTRNILVRAREIFRQVLGPLDLNSVFQKCRFGPGTSSSCRKASIHIYGKLRADIDVTDQALPWMEELLISRPDLSVQAMDTTVFFPKTTYAIGGIMRFVDKNAKTKRQIVVEPHGNMCLQLGAGEYISSRLAYAGLPKHRQADINKQLALSSSLSNELATWDLKCGSGIICKELVNFLAAPDWRRFLDDIRSHYVYEEVMDEAGVACTPPVKLHKFSEMGNGFTFELETLIFWSLLRASVLYDGISDKQCYVFGDDLIFPKDGAPGMKKLFDDIGLVINVDKSYSDGPFRESCGGDYYLGNYVRPFFLSEERYDAIALIGVANKIRRWAARSSLYGLGMHGEVLSEKEAPFCDIRARLAWLYIVDLLKRSHIPLVVGSYDRGDTVLWALPEEDDYFDRGSYVFEREQSKINRGLYQRESLLLALNNSYSAFPFYTGRRYHYVMRDDVIPGSLPEVRRPDTKMRSLCVNTEAFLGPYDAPMWR